MSGHIIILIGAARSGKSTYSNKLLKQIDNRNKVVVNSDNIRLAIHGNRYISLTEPLVFAITEIMVRSLYIAKYTIVLDETSTTTNSIRKWLSIDPDAEAVYIPATREECYERARLTGQEDLINKGVIDRHFNNLCRLCYDAWDRYRFEVGEFSYFQIFKEPNEEYLMKAVEYIRKEIKDAQ